MNPHTLIARGVLGLAFAGILTAGGYAQDPTPQQQDIRNDQKDVVKDRQDLRQDRADRNQG